MRYVKISYLVFLLLLLLPLVQHLLPFADEGGMHGQVIETPKPEYSWGKFDSLLYQDQTEKYLSQQFGFRKTVLRLRNQFYFSVFDQSPDAKLYLGKNNMVYENLYVDEYFGNTWAGEKHIHDMTTDLKRLQDSLARHHKMLYIVIAPSKAFYYAENLSPSRDMTPRNNERNYESFCREARKQGLQFADFNAWFLQMKGKTPHPLYQPGGSHWTIYGASLAFDSIYKAMSRHFAVNEQKEFPELKIKKFYPWPKSGEDYDAITIMNLLFPGKREPSFYPEIEVNRNGKYIPRVLGVTDSYYGTQVVTHLPDSCFASPDYWFMNYQLMPESKYDTMPRNENLIASEVRNHDIIYYLVTPHNIPGMGWGFTEKALRSFARDSAFQPPVFDFAFYKKLEETDQYVRSNKDWLHGILIQARNEKADPETLLYRNNHAVVGGPDWEKK